MELAKVVGQVVSTVRCAGMPHNSLLLVELIDNFDTPLSSSTPRGICHVAVDPIGAGEGEWVIVTRGSSARAAFEPDAPLDLAIVGIVDHVNADKKALYRKNG